MPITVGSVGDIISLILLTKDVIECLNSSRGSGAEYQELIKELWVLERTLLEVEALSRSSDKTVELNALCATTRRAADHCRHSLNEFLDKIKKYKVGLRESGSGNALQDAKSKLQWRLFARDDVAKFRSELCAHTSSIGMLLTIASVRNHGLGADMQKTALEEVRKQLEENNSLIKEHNKSLADITEVPRLQWVKQIGCDIKYMMFKIFAVNIAMYKAVLNIQAGLPSSLERALIQEPFILEDAIGRIAPIHMQFISSWEAFEAVLELRFRNAPGYRKVQNRKYTFQEHGTKKDIVRTRPWDASFLPGQKIDMSLIYKGFEKEGAGSVCPACRNPSVEAQDTEVQCSKCMIWYRRITDLDDDRDPSEYGKQLLSVPQLKRQSSNDRGDNSPRQTSSAMDLPDLAPNSTQFDDEDDDQNDEEMLYIKRVRIHLTRNLHEHQYSPQNGYIDGPHQFLARPPPEYVTMLSKNPPSLKINLTIEEQGVILTRLYDALSQCAFDFLATYQIPLPLDPSMRALERPSDLNWVEWVHLLKQLAMKKCILARVLCGDEINQLPAVLESSLEVGPISQPKVQRDDRNVLQMLFAGIQVAKLLRDSRAMDYLDAMYTATENIRQERSLFESRS